MSHLLVLLAQPFRTLSLPPPNSFASQTVIITGANTGLGLETARHIVNLGASKVILGVRTYSKGVAAKDQIEASSGRTGVVEVWEVDLESFSSVKSFASRAAQLERLDTAIMNAGLASGQWNLSPEGWEKQLQVNVLSTALLSLLLMPILVRARRDYVSSNPHLVLLGSDVHVAAKFKERNSDNILAALNEKKTWEKTSSDPVERYGISKLFDLYIAKELAAITPWINDKPAITVDVVAPGFCKSELLSREEGAPWVLKVIQFLVARTLPEGSKTIVDAAVRDVDAHGKYLDHQKIARPAYSVTSDDGMRACKKVWGEIVEILRKVDPRVGSISQGKM